MQQAVLLTSTGFVYKPVIATESLSPVAPDQRGGLRAGLAVRTRRPLAGPLRNNVG